MRKLQLIIACICMGWTVKAQDTLKTVQLDEVVVTGTKSAIPVEKSGKSIFKITLKDIESSGSRTVADILNEVRGVQMDGNFGPLGTNIGYFVRGASSKRTLVLIDGVPFNDPSGIDQTYDLRLLDLDQVESIEILKGGLSTLYGTGAAAGVINITLKKAKEKGVIGTVSFDYGSFNTVNPNLSISKKSEELSIVINAGYRKSDGFSAAKDQSGSENFDDDGFEGFNFLGKVGYEFNDRFDIVFTGALDDFRADYDQGAFTDGDNFTEYQQIRMGLSPKLKWQGGNLRGDFFITNLDRLFNSPDFFDPNARFVDEYDAANTQFDLVIDQNLNENFKLIGGINYQRLAYSQPSIDETNFTMIDPYASLIFDQSSFNFQVGARLNNHSEYGNNFVWNVNPSYSINSGESTIKVFASYSSSFIAPSLFQLFGPFGANTALEPEESKSAEGGFTLLQGRVKVEAVYFYRKDKNLIIFTDQYDNAGETIETDGIEFNGAFDLSEKISLSANYTFLRRLDDSRLYRIPSHKYGASLGYQPLDGLNISLNYLHTGERRQQYFNNTTFTLDEAELKAFDLLDLITSFQYQSFTFSAGINNLLDEDYQAIYGFNSVERNYTIGVKYQFN
ncbi:TonB-dependent receptor [Ekhidna sp.]|uniref:TonB-dependent receptor plug domain-containing protein n=1 Tax=Ekhidna sp. TaxID=2608089 RepID=UPI003297EF86